MVYNTEDIPLIQCERIYQRMLGMKKFDHPNVLKYLYVEHNSDWNEITVITESVKTLKQYLKKVGHPKLKVISNWWFKIWNGIEYLLSHGVTQINLEPDCIFTTDEYEIKIKPSFTHQLIMARKGHDESFKKVKQADESNIVYYFGKIVLFMLFHQTSVHKAITKLLQSSNSELLFTEIKNKELKNLLVRCLSDKHYKTIKELKQDPFLNNEQIESRLDWGGRLLEYLENSKLKRTKFDDISTIYNSIRDEDTKCKLILFPFLRSNIILTNVRNKLCGVAKLSSRMKKRKKKGKKGKKKASDMQWRSTTKAQVDMMQRSDSLAAYRIDYNVPKDKKKKTKKTHKRFAQTNHNLKPALGKNISINDDKSVRRTGRIEKVFKEDSDDRFLDGFQANLKKNYTGLQKLDLDKQKSEDYRKRWRMMKRLKSMDITDPQHMLMEVPWLLTSVPPGAGGKLDTIYNRTLSMLWYTNCNLCSSPVNRVERVNPARGNLTLVPLKITLQNNKSKFEVWFDYDIVKDTEIKVAEELRTALELPPKYDKRIAQIIKAVLRDKFVMTEMIIYTNKQNKNHQYGHLPRIAERRKNILQWIHEKTSNDQVAHSFQNSLDEKLHLLQRKKLDRSQRKFHKKLLERTHSRLNYINKQGMNSRKPKLNDSEHVNYKTTDINSNFFNIYEYHYSFTASSQLKHSFHSTFDRLGSFRSSKFTDFPSLFIEKALSEYDIKYYTHYEDIVEPKILDFSFETSEIDQDQNFKQKNPPFDAGNLSEIEHQPIVCASGRENLINDLNLLK